MNKKGGECIMKNRIKKIRKELDLTQQAFAEKIGTSQNVLANYEIGRRNPSASVINNICKTFSVNEEWLRTGQGKMFIEVSRDEQITTFIGEIQMNVDDSFKKRFISMLASLEESDWEVLERIASKLHKEGD